MYHALLSPNLSMDVDGGYRGPDNQVHHAEGFHFVSNLSLWDTYRAEQPLMTLLEPEARTSDLVSSMLASRRESPFGILPIWQVQGLETWCMIGYHAVPEIADAYLKGIGGFDADEALRAMVASATYGPYGSLGEYMRLGYVPVDHDDEAASKTIEYAFDDWTIARMAGAMKHTGRPTPLPNERPTGATSSTPKMALWSRVWPTASIAFHSILRGPEPVAALPKATPGNIRGISRRMCRGSSICWAVNSSSSPSSTRCSTPGSTRISMRMSRISAA